MFARCLLNPADDRSRKRWRKVLKERASDVMEISYAEGESSDATSLHACVF